MIINTLSSDPSIALELGRRIARTEERRRRQRHGSLSEMWNRLFERHPVKLIREHA